MSPRILAGSGTLLVLLAAPAAAQAAPTIQPLKPCYVTAQSNGVQQRENVQIAGAGFTPNSDVALAIDGAVVPGYEALKAGLSGELTAVPPVDAPFVESGRRPFTITLTETANPANTVSAAAESAALAAWYTPDSPRPSQKVRFRGLGFTEDKPIYAHYIRKDKLRKTVRMARKPRACGGFRTRKRLFPMKTPRLGKWRLQFDQSKRYVDPDVTPITYAERGIRVRLVRD